jgi:hypothetical protein
MIYIATPPFLHHPQGPTSDGLGPCGTKAAHGPKGV